MNILRKRVARAQRSPKAMALTALLAVIMMGLAPTPAGAWITTATEPPVVADDNYDGGSTGGGSTGGTSDTGGNLNGLPTDPPPGAVQVPCIFVTAALSTNTAQILAKANEAIPGTEYRKNNRKTLRMDWVRSVVIRPDCTSNIGLDVTLLRKIRRNARGNMGLGSDVSFYLAQGATGLVSHLCLRNIRVTELDLDYTLEFGEGFYEPDIEDRLKDGICFVVPL